MLAEMSHFRFYICSSKSSRNRFYLHIRKAYIAKMMSLKQWAVRLNRLVAFNAVQTSKRDGKDKKFRFFFPILLLENKPTHD